MANNKKIIKKVAKKGVAWTHGKGYHWFNDKLLPIISNNIEIIDKQLLSDFWYVIGDVYDLNSSPQIAIKAYKKSIKYDPDHGEAFRELANMYQNIGDIKMAFKYINKALELIPNDEHSKIDKELITDEIDDPDYPYYSQDLLELQCNELLAENSYTLVLEKLKHKRRINYRKLKARAYGANKELKSYLHEWLLIVKHNETVEFEYADWFYMPDEIYYSNQFWEILYEKKGIELKGFLPNFSSLYKNYKTSIDTKEMKQLVILSIILKNSNNEVALSQLSKKFPKWKELKKLIKDDKWPCFS